MVFVGTLERKKGPTFAMATALSRVLEWQKAQEEAAKQLSKRRRVFVKLEDLMKLDAQSEVGICEQIEKSQETMSISQSLQASKVDEWDTSWVANTIIANICEDVAFEMHRAAKTGAMSLKVLYGPSRAGLAAAAAAEAEATNAEATNAAATIAAAAITTANDAWASPHKKVVHSDETCENSSNISSSAATGATKARPRLLQGGLVEPISKMRHKKP